MDVALHNKLDAATGERGSPEDAGKTSRNLINSLSPTVTDPNAYTPEFKGFLVKVEKA